MEKVAFNYYHGKESEQFSFFRIPKSLYTDPIFKNLSSDAKVLYGVFLNWIELSKDNNINLGVYGILKEYSLDKYTWRQMA